MRPVRVSLYRLLIGGQPANPNGPQFRLNGDPASRRGPVYEPLRENVDFYVDPSQLWVMLAQPLDPNKERLVVAYAVRIAGRDTVIASTGGTPDATRVDGRDQVANLLWDPNVRPGDAAFAREIRAAAPSLHIHAFSPMEVINGVSRTGLPLREFLTELRAGNG